MMYLVAKPYSPRGSVCGDSPHTMGGRRSRHWCGPGPFRETNKGPGSEGYQTVERSKLSYRKRKTETKNKLNELINT